MNYAEILAGGKGTRMGNVPLPKQFLNLGGKPIIIQTTEKFLANMYIDKIMLVVPSGWIQYTTDIINKFIDNDDKNRIFIIAGGENRSETIMNGIRFIENNFGIQDDDIVITHDAVRPFVSQRIITENVIETIKHGAVDTVIPAIDTIVKSDTENEFIGDIPERKFMYQGQTPQSFNIKLLISSFKNLNNEQKNILTDAAKIVLMSQNDNNVKFVIGEQMNFKITTSFDFKLAESIVMEGL